MDFMTYFKQLKGDTLNQVTLINGEETYLIDNLTKYISDHFLKPMTRDFNLTQVETIIDVDTVISMAMTLPFFDDKRLILFQNTGLLKVVKDEQEEKLINFLTDLPAHIYVVFSETELDKRKKIYKHLSKVADLVTVDRLLRPELVKWIAKRFKLYNKEVNLHVINHFIERINYLDPESGKNLYAVDNTIRMMSGVDGPIHEAIINQYVEIPIEHNIFKMMDAISGRKMSEAIKILNYFVAGGEPEIKIFYLINQQFRNIYKTKLLLDAGHSSGTVASKLEIHPFVAKKAGSFARQFTNSELSKIIEILEEVDVMMKSSGLPPLLLIEKALFQISEVPK